MQHKSLYLLLNQLEEELGRNSLWSASAPTTLESESTTPFSADTMPLENWLQWLFLPRMHKLLERQESLPMQCHITPYAETAWAKTQPLYRNISSKELLRLLSQIDQYISDSV